MISLVVLYHAGLVYESSRIVAFFWIVDDPSTSAFPGILNMIIDAARNGDARFAEACYPDVI